MSGKQTIPARHGTATFVPKGDTIKIINTYGRQVVDTWAFALYPPPTEKEMREDREKADEETKKAAQDVKGSAGGKEKAKPEEKKEEKVEEKGSKDKKEGKDSKKDEKQSEEQSKKSPEAKEEGKPDTAKSPQEPASPKEGKKTWGAYLPSFRRTKTSQQAQQQGQGAKKEESKPQEKGSTEGDTNSKGWSAYLPSGRGFTSYLPSKSSMSAFAASHHVRDPEKSYAEQLYEFSKTPVGAAGLSASVSAATGSGYASTFYAAYSAYSQTTLARASAPPMEYLSMPHSRASTGHMVPRVGDTLVTNLRAPLLTVMEDTSPGAHDTLVAACDPQRYRELGVEKWEEHGSCAENLVLALKELNEKNGLKGPKAVGADVSVNSVPAPFNLFMNIPWTQGGDIKFEAPTTKRGDYVRFKAERDCVVVMSACPQDVLAINGGKCMVAHFVVEASPGEEAEQKAQKESGKEPKQKDQKQNDQKQKDQKPEQASAKTEAAPSPSSRPKVGSRQPSGTSTSMRGVERKQSGTPAKLDRKPSGVSTPAIPERKPSEQSVDTTPQTPKKKPKKLQVRSTPNGVGSPAAKGG